MDISNGHSDLAEFFDFGEAAMPDVIHHQSENLVPVSSEGNSSLCPAHGTDSTDGCICHGFMGNFEIPEAAAQPLNKDEWNPDFSSWIPRYSKPEHACDYCRSRHLECFITYEGQSACSPCSALFRPCSFSEPSAEPMRQSRKRLDTLDIVSEDTAHIFGGLTAKTRPMRSLGHTGPIEDDDDAENKNMKKGGIRFPRAAIKILKDWMEEHIDHPYPTEEDKLDLKEKTGLTSSQVSNWMANTRRRQKSRPKRTSSPSIRPTEAINIPSGRTWESLNPFERWKHSPPENEPAPMTAIAKAVENFDPPEPPSLSSSFGNGRRGESNGSSGSFSVFRAPSTTSLETGATNFSSGSAHSLRSAWSHGSRNSRNSFNTFDSFGSNPTKERRRRRRVQTRSSKADPDLANGRLFQCTFCTDSFKSKYDWSRHEKSLHLSLEKWICAPLGDVITDPTTGSRKCTYCDTLEATRDHLETHNHAACEEKGLEARTFYRKDHLRQHLRLIHNNCKMTPSMETWKSEATFIRCRCGFCGAEFTRWQDRVDHLAKEFRNGAKMKDWKGCRGLDPNVAALVMNAMPPYLIGNESKSPFPFSASNTASMAPDLYSHGKIIDLEYSIPTSRGKLNGPSSPLSQEGGPGGLQTAGPGLNTDLFMAEFCAQSTFPSASGSALTSPTWASQTTPNSSTSSQPTMSTCWEILTLSLGRFVRQTLEKDGPGSCTDEMLQAQARRILYGDDDPWNQTAADNPEWLSLFKKAHGIVDVPTDYDRLDALEDLGVNIHTGDMTAFDQYPLMGNGPITEIDSNGKGERRLGGTGARALDLDLGTVQECFKYPGWGQIAEMECDEVTHPQIVDGDMGELQLFNWDEGLDGAVFNTGCGA